LSDQPWRQLLPPPLVSLHNAVMSKMGSEVSSGEESSFGESSWSQSTARAGQTGEEDSTASAEEDGFEWLPLPADRHKLPMRVKAGGIPHDFLAGESREASEKKLRDFFGTYGTLDPSNTLLTSNPHLSLCFTMRGAVYNNKAEKTPGTLAPDAVDFFFAGEKIAQRQQDADRDHAQAVQLLELVRP
jgi:hypothetical protein